MSTLELVKKKIEIKFGEQTFAMTAPTYKQTLDYRKETKDLAENEAAESLMKYLETLGMPKEVVEQLEVDHLTQVLEAVMSSKKK